jgi:hypothetical protein
MNANSPLVRAVVGLGTVALAGLVIVISFSGPRAPAHSLTAEDGDEVSMGDMPYLPRGA